jgi:uncharacterized membrane protein
MEFQMNSGQNIEQSDSLKTVAWITYIAFIISIFTGGLGFIIGMIVAYVKRNDSEGTIYNSHFNYLISTAWWSIVWCFIGAVTAFFIVGFFILIFTGVWFIYRLIKGVLRLSENKPAR